MRLQYKDRVLNGPDFIQPDPRVMALELVDEEKVSVEYMLLACLKFMSHDDIVEMFNINCFDADGLLEDYGLEIVA